VSSTSVHVFETLSLTALHENDAVSLTGVQLFETPGSIFAHARTKGVPRAVLTLMPVTETTCSGTAVTLAKVEVIGMPVGLT
jgi:hypothetical protein